MCLRQMVFEVHHLLGNLVLACLSVQCCRLQAPYVHTVGSIRASTAIEVAPCIAIWVVIFRIPQVSTDFSAVDL